MTRKSKNISQKEIGSKLGVTQQIISQIERNSKNMTLPILIDLIEVLDLECNLSRHFNCDFQIISIKK